LPGFGQKGETIIAPQTPKQTEKGKEKKYLPTVGGEPIEQRQRENMKGCRGGKEHPKVEFQPVLTQPLLRGIVLTPLNASKREPVANNDSRKKEPVQGSEN